jgi:quercetin dioxygenase-like cupin family protein
VTVLARSPTVHVVHIAFEPGGIVGRHPAAIDQVFVVVSGRGWVSGRDGGRHPVAAGTAVVWEQGEEHESGTADGMEAVIVEAVGLAPAVER